MGEDQSVSKQQSKEINDENQFITNTKARQKGEIACSVLDSSGEAVCAGVRCGTPTGDCGRKETAYECIEENGTGSLPTGMSFEEFREAWNDEETRSELEAVGYESIDVK